MTGSYTPGYAFQFVLGLVFATLLLLVMPGRKKA